MSKFQIYKDESGKEESWRWRLIGDNGKEIAKSEEAFVKRSVVRSIKTMQGKVSANTPIFEGESLKNSDKGYRFEYSQSDKGKNWYWRLKADNNELIAIGEEGFSSKESVRRRIENVASEIPKAEIVWKNPEDAPASSDKKEDDTKNDPSIPPGS